MAFRVILFFIMLCVFQDSGFAARSSEAAVSLFPYYGFVQLEGKPIDSMNKRLGNSARLSQPYAFGNQAGYGLQAGFWGRDQRQYYGLNVFASSKELSGKSSFAGVMGNSALAMSGYFIDYGFRFIPFKTKFKPSKPNGVTDRIKVTALASAGYLSFEYSNKIEDLDNDTDIQYKYTSDRLAVGAQLKAAIIVLPWLHLIIFDAQATALLTLSSQMNLLSYKVAGRNEGPIAETELTKSLNSEVTMLSAFWGIEFCL